MDLRSWDLDDAQMAAVLDGSAAVTLVGGPGTGRTRAVLARCWRLLEGGVPGGAMEVLVGSENSAREASEVLAAVGDCRVETVAGFCVRLLRGVEGGGFSVLSDRDAAEMLTWCMQGGWYDEVSGGDDRAVPRRSWMRAVALRALSRGDTGADGWERYRGECESRMMLDRGLLVEKTADLLAEDGDLLAALRMGGCRWLSADDVQAWSMEERRLLRVLVGDGMRVTLSSDAGQRVRSGVDPVVSLSWGDGLARSEHRLALNHRATGAISDVLGRLSGFVQDSARPWGTSPAWLTGHTPGEAEALAAETIRGWLDLGLGARDVAVIDLGRGVGGMMGMGVQLARLGLDLAGRWDGRAWAADAEDAEAVLRLLVNPRDVVALSRTRRRADNLGAREIDGRWLRRVARESVDWEGDLMEASARLEGAGALRGAERDWLLEVEGCVRALGNCSSGVGWFDLMELRRTRVFGQWAEESAAFAELSQQVAAVERSGSGLWGLREMLDARALGGWGGGCVDGVEFLTVDDVVGREWSGVCVLNAVRPRSASAVDGKLREMYVACGRARDLLALCDYRCDYQSRGVEPLLVRPSEVRLL